MALSYGFHLELALFKWRRKQAQRLALRAIQRWVRECHRDKTRRQERLVEKSYLPSVLVEEIPDFPKIHNNVLAADLMGEPKLEVEQFVQTGHAGAYVCVRGMNRFIVNQGKVPSSLKTRINDYRVWHAMCLGCVPEDLISSRHVKMPGEADGPITRAHSNRQIGRDAKIAAGMGADFSDEEPFDVSDDGTTSEEMRQPAHFSKHRCDFAKLSSLDNHLLEGTMVILLTETKLRGRTAGYAEYQFLLPDGSRRRLSAKEKMSNKVKALIEEYEEWHVLQVGMRGLPWINDQSMLDDSEEESEEEQLPFDEHDLNDESEPDDLDNMETCRQVAEKDLAQRGLQDYCVVRHIDTMSWSSETLSHFAKSGNVAILPQVCEAVRELAGKPVLVYEMAADKKETVTMSEQDLVEAWFALDATVIGEAADSSLNKPAVMVQTATGAGQPKSMAISMPVISLFRSLEAAVKQMKCMELGRSNGRHSVMPVGVLVATARMCEK